MNVTSSHGSRPPYTTDQLMADVELLTTMLERHRDGTAFDVRAWLQDPGMQAAARIVDSSELRRLIDAQD